MSFVKDDSKEPNKGFANYHTISEKLGTFVSINLDIKKSDGKIIFIVDVSGSMAGGPITNVNTVLDNIHKVSPNHILMTYNTSVKQMMLTDYVAAPPKPNDRTDFAGVFGHMQKYIMTDKSDLSFIFFTDGEDVVSTEKQLADAMNYFTVVSNYDKNRKISVHVIGYGSDVKADFLMKVMKMGSLEGTFRYANQVAELQEKFLDMFELMSNTVDCEITINNKTYQAKATVSDNKQYKLELLIDTKDILNATKLIVRIKNKNTEYEIKKMEKITPMIKIKSLELRQPNSEEDVIEIMNELNNIMLKGLSAVERIEFEEIRKDMNERLMSYLKLFNQLKMGVIKEVSKLKLNELKYEAVFSKERRKRSMEKRININLKYYEKIDTLLKEAHSQITKEDFASLKELADTKSLSCIYSIATLDEIMRDTTDDFLCLGARIKRNEVAIDSPTTGIQLLEVSNSIVSYHSFIDAMNKSISDRGQNKASGGFVVSKKSDREDANDHKTLFKKDSDGDEKDKVVNPLVQPAAAAVAVNNCANPNPEPKPEDQEVYAMIGQQREKINCVIPLYLHPAHANRIKILKQSWSGYFFTLDPYGYEKNQDLGMITLLGSVISKYNKTDSFKFYISELTKLCYDVLLPSADCRLAYPYEKYKAFVETVHGRERQYVQNLMTQLTIAFLKDSASLSKNENKGYPELKANLYPIYFESIKRSVRDVYSGNKIEAHKIAHILCYGEFKKNKDVKSDKTPHHVKLKQMEDKFAEYFYSPASIAPPQIVFDEKNDNNKNVLMPATTDDVKPYILDMLTNYPVPKFMESFLTALTLYDPTFKYEKLFPKTTEEFEFFRRNLLLSYYYFNDYPDVKVNEKNVIDIVHAKFQKDQEMSDKNADNENLIQEIANVIIGVDNIDAFAGMLLTYCPTWSSKTFVKVVDGVIRKADKEKLIAIMMNAVNDNIIYTEFKDNVWQPPSYEILRKITDILGKEKVAEIEKYHRTNKRMVFHKYRLTNLKNRHGHNNTSPNDKLTYYFSQYDF